MQKPKFKTTDRAAWVFLHTRLKPDPIARMDRRTATRNGYLGSASQRLNIPEAELPLPLVNEPMSRYIDRVKSARKDSAKATRA